MPALSVISCLFCQGIGCALCRPEKSWHNKKSANKLKKDSGKYKDQKQKTAKHPAPDACEKCCRIPGDLAVDRCAFCLPDPEGQRMCVVCGDRPSRGGFGLCRKCYNSMPAKERQKLPPRPRHFAPPYWATTDPADPPEPTSYKPQTPQKIAVMAQRAILRQELFHPDDAGNRGLDEPAYLTAFGAMALRLFAPRGIHWVAEMRKWRARPWWGYERFHLGFYRDQADAILAVRRWHELAEKMGPREAMLKIRSSRKSAA